MTEPDDERELRPRRLHPLSPVFEIGRSFASLVLPGLVFLFLKRGDSYEVWYMAFFVPAVIVSLKRYVFLRYGITGDHLVVREGMIFKKIRHVPLARIQNIDTVQNPLHRLFRVVEVRIETAGGSEPEAVLRVLSVQRLNEIRDGVFRERGGARSAATSDADADERAIDGDGEGDASLSAGPRPFFRMRPLDVTYFGLLSQKGVAVLVGLYFLVWEFELTDRVVELMPVEPEQLPALFPVWVWLAIGVVFVFLLQVITVGWAFVTLHDFHIARAKDDLRTTCGLWTRQSATLPRHRIQFLAVEEGWLQRVFGRLSIRAVSAGGDSTGDSQVSRKWLVPLAERSELAGILEEVQPGLPIEAAAWSPVHPGARARLLKRWTLVALIPALIVAKDAPVWGAVVFAALVAVAAFASRARARRLGYALTDSALLVRDGVMKHVRYAVRFSKVQSVSLTQTPFDRRYGTATLRIDTASGGGSGPLMSIPFLDREVAGALARTVRHGAASTAFRW